jgi:hypothetical protein
MIIFPSMTLGIKSGQHSVNQKKVLLIISAMIHIMEISLHLAHLMEETPGEIDISGLEILPMLVQISGKENGIVIHH